jgi:hypothetical protein
MVKVYDIEQDAMVEVTQQMVDFWTATNQAVGTILAPACGNSQDPRVLNAWEDFLDVVAKSAPHA